MTEYLTEQEQIELFKKWLKQYSTLIIGGIALALLLTSGYRFWHNRQMNQTTKASTLYDEMLTIRAQNNADSTKLMAEQLLKKSPETSYADMAALMLARDFTIKKDYVNAELNLNKVAQSSKDDSIRQIARIRLARIKITNNQAEEALTLLKKIDDPNFISLIDETIGDAYLGLNKPELARQAYQKALSNLANAEVMRPLLQMKYDNLST